MSHDLVTDFVRWLGADDVRLVGMALLPVVLAWLSEKVRMDRFLLERVERGRGQASTRMPPMTRMSRPPREALNDSMA